MYVFCLPILLPWDKTDFKLLNLISIQRQKKIQNYIYETDRKLSLYAALLVRYSLSIITGIPPHELVFGIDDRMKPLLLSASNFHFNLSHTHGFILCGISNEDTIGVDVEKISPISFKVVKQIFHSEEIQYIENALTSERDIRIYEIWTKKEAYSKKIGTGLNRDLLSCNTLSSAFSSSLHTWRHNNFICSVCGNLITPININYITESDLQNYFIHLYEKLFQLVD